VTHTEALIKGDKKVKKGVDKEEMRGYNSKAPLRNGEFIGSESTLKIKQRLKKKPLKFF